MTTTGTSSSSLGGFLEDMGYGGAKAAREDEALSFQEYVDEASGPSPLARDSAEHVNQGFTGADGPTGSDPESEQSSQNGTSTAVAAAPFEGQYYSTTWPVDPAEIDPEKAEASITAVKNAMVAEGLDPDSVKFTYFESRVWCPGSSWINEMLRIETGDGKCLDFSARLTERSPEVTVCDVRHMLEGTGGWATPS